LNRLETQLKNVLGELDLEYYPTGGTQVPVMNLVPGAPSDEHLEIDGVIRSGNTAALVEITSQKSKNTAKIKRFVRHADIFRNSDVPLRKRFRLIGVPGNRASRFDAIEEWRYLYIGNGPELRERGIRPSRFPEAENRLTLLNDEEWAYLRLLQRNLGSLAQYELLAALNLTPGHESGVPETELKCECIQLKGRKLGRRMPKADLFVAAIPVDDLLKMCRVLRYQKLPMRVGVGQTTAEEAGYQRLLSIEKLQDLSKYIGRDALVAFPSPIVVVARNCEAITENGLRKLRLPKRYASLDVIDGQHRLFGYASASPTVKTNAQLLVTVVQFKGASDAQTNRYAATTFITINKNQAKVKRDLIILTSYDALGHDTGEAVAGKVLQKLDAKRGNPLAGRFRIRPLGSRSGGLRRLPIVTIALEIAVLVDKEYVGGLTSARRKHFFALTSTTATKFARKDERVRVGGFTPIPRTVELSSISSF
jgi:DGQHR domain-containing protein